MSNNVQQLTNNIPRYSPDGEWSRHQAGPGIATVEAHTLKPTAM